MQLNQRFVVNHPRPVVWDFFERMEKVAPCMPGASLTEPPVGNIAKFKFNVKLGPISATFVGESQLERDEATFRGVMRGSARDNRGDSRVKSVVEHVLTEEAEGARTAVDISVDFTLTGRLAQFSRGGIVNDLASRLTAEFAKNLEVALAAQTAAVSSPTTAGEAAPAPPLIAPAPELDAGRLLSSVIWSRIKAFFQALFGR